MSRTHPTAGWSRSAPPSVPRLSGHGNVPPSPGPRSTAPAKSSAALSLLPRHPPSPTRYPPALNVHWTPGPGSPDTSCSFPRQRMVASDDVVVDVIGILAARCNTEAAQTQNRKASGFDESQPAPSTSAASGSATRPPAASPATERARAAVCQESGRSGGAASSERRQGPSQAPGEPCRAPWRGRRNTKWWSDGTPFGSPLRRAVLQVIQAPGSSLRSQGTIGRPAGWGTGALEIWPERSLTAFVQFPSPPRKAR